MAGLIVVLPMLLTPMPSAGGSQGCSVSDSQGRCLVAAIDPGRPGGPADPRVGGTPPALEPKKANTPAKTPAAPAAPKRQLLTRPLGLGGGLAQDLDPAEVLAVAPLPAPAAPNPAPAPAVTAQVLAQRAINLLTLDPPALHTSVTGSGFVGVPLWLWIDGAAAAPKSATATAGAAQVTATARLTSVEWSMGPPGAEVRCAGPGTPWTGQDGPSPDCGYVYELRSLPERTGGTGRWTVTATCVWTVTWAGVSGGAPVDGQQIVQVSADATVAVGEVQVLVGGGNR